MRNWSIPIARLFGVEVRLHLTFVLLLLFVWLTEAAGPHAAGARRALALVGAILLSVVLHELGHALAAIRRGVNARAIILLPIGGITVSDESAHTATGSRQEIRIALAGPLVNLAVAGATAALIMWLAPQNLTTRPLLHSAHLLRSAVWINLFLGAFNLLPGYPLDGGRVLRAWFLRRYDPVQATRRAIAVGQFFAMVFIFAGIWNTWLMLVGFFLFVGAQLEDRSAVFHSVLESVRMEDVMLTDFSTLSPADTLEDALHKAVHSLQDDFPVVRGADLVGVISRQHILDNLRTHGNGYVQSVMTREFDVAQRGDSLASGFGKITGKGATLIPVVDGERLVGIITLQNLMHSMSLLAETRKLRRNQRPESAS
ncbi:MAG: site-2 protease family protein [Terriglobales bacterium]